jgi:putative IMPACT (imprinted ancient) family translation regulator
MAGGQSAANDDGEPGGTAGRPMLEVLRHQQLEGVLATVVRYFGGIKLGAGGLVRAYTDAIAQALLGATLVPLVPHVLLQCAVPYAMEGMVRREVAAVEGTLARVRHAELVHFDIDVAQPLATALRTRVDDACQGRAVWSNG